MLQCLALTTRLPRLIVTTLLHIECSPRKQRSASLQVARSFIDRYLEHHPQTHVETLDLWGTHVPLVPLIRAISVPSTLNISLAPLARLLTVRVKPVMV